MWLAQDARPKLSHLMIMMIPRNNILMCPPGWSRISIVYIGCFSTRTKGNGKSSSRSMTVANPTPPKCQRFSQSVVSSNSVCAVSLCCRQSPAKSSSSFHTYKVLWCIFGQPMLLGGVLDIQCQSLPQVVFLDATDRIHGSHVTPQTNQLNTQICPLLNDLVSMIGELRWRGIRIPLDVRRNELSWAKASILFSR